MGNFLLRFRREFVAFDLKSLEFKAKVLDVYDGDTITIGYKFRGIYWRSQLRIYGIDTPEIRILAQKERAVKARDYLKERILNKIVHIKMNNRADKYGRLLGEVFYRGENLTTTMINLGLGVPYFGGKKESS